MPLAEKRGTRRLPFRSFAVEEKDEPTIEESLQREGDRGVRPDRHRRPFHAREPRDHRELRALGVLAGRLDRVRRRAWLPPATAGPAGLGTARDRIRPVLPASDAGRLLD